MITHAERTSDVVLYGASSNYLSNSGGAATGTQAGQAGNNSAAEPPNQPATYFYHQPPSSSSLAGALGQPWVQTREAESMQTSRRTESNASSSQRPLSAQPLPDASSTDPQSVATPAFAPTFGNFSNPSFNAGMMQGTSWTASGDQTYQHTIMQNVHAQATPFRSESAAQQQTLLMDDSFAGHPNDYLLYGRPMGGMLPFVSGLQQWQPPDGNAAFTSPELLASFQNTGPWPLEAYQSHLSHAHGHQDSGVFQAPPLPIMNHGTESASVQADEFASANVQQQWGTENYGHFQEPSQAGYVSGPFIMGDA